MEAAVVFCVVLAGGGVPPSSLETYSVPSKVMTEGSLVNGRRRYAINNFDRIAEQMPPLYWLPILVPIRDSLNEALRELWLYTSTLLPNLQKVGCNRKH